jgi:hypothetical protein
MITSKKWGGMLLVCLLLFVAACGGAEEPADPVETPEAPEAPVPAQTLTVTIDGDGNFDPTSIAPNPGDTVSFVAGGGDAVLCVDPEALFGEGRYAIANGANLDLTVQAAAIHVDFGYIACLGDLEMTCDVCRQGVRGTEGGGRTGP